MPQNKQAKFFYGYVVLAGYIFDVRGSYNLVFLIYGVATAIALGLILLLKPTRQVGEKG